MKMPQEIVAGYVIPYGEQAALTEEITQAIAAAREEGRREGLLQAEHYLREVPIPNESKRQTVLLVNCAEAIRALASQPKPEPAVTCEGCKRGIPLERTVFHAEDTFDEKIGKHVVYSPCTAKPEGGTCPACADLTITAAAHTCGAAGPGTKRG